MAKENLIFSVTLINFNTDPISVSLFDERLPDFLLLHPILE